MSPSLEKEVEVLKKLPIKKLGKGLRIYRILYFLNSEAFTFIYSLLCCTLPLLFFKFSIVTWFLVLLLHYFIYWQQFKPYLDKKYDTDKENEELVILMRELRILLKQKE